MTPETCQEHYLVLLAQCTDISNQTFLADSDGLHPRSHTFVDDLDKWTSILEGRLETKVLNAANREYQFGLLALTMGQYRQAFASLRLVLEISLAALFYSAKEIELRLWLAGVRDTSWTELVDDDLGIFSDKFAQAFFSELAGERKHYGLLARQVYRECSEFVHGNPSALLSLPSSLAFDAEAFNSWHEKASTIRLVLTFGFCLRYLKDMKAEHILDVEHLIMDQLGSLPQIRFAIGMVTGG